MTVDADPGHQEPAAPVTRSETRLGIWERIKDHKVPQWGITYLGAALALAQAQELIANAFAWPPVATRAVVTALIVGFPIALTIAWYHGHRALRRVSVGELSILSALALIGVLFFTVALRRDAAFDGRDTQTLNAGIAALPTAVAGAAAPRSAGVLPNKVAVLPCENQSPDPDDAYFAAGLHQDIIWQLDKLRNLNPIPRLTVLRYADTRLSTAEIAAELSVRALLACTIRYADNRIRITAELIDSSGLQTLWQDDYLPSLDDVADVFAVQADIAMNIANALSVVFTPGERELLEKPPTVSSQAYVLFLKAYTEPDYDTTLALFEQAVAADPTFAAPRAALAFLWATELINTSYSAAIAADARDAREAEVREFAERALELDPAIPFARSALTVIDMLQWRWTSAYTRLVEARDRTPNDVTQWDLFLLSYLGRHTEAMDIVQRGSELYPNDLDNNFLWAGWAAGFSGRYDEAAAAFAKVVAEAPGNQGLLARDWLVRMDIARGNQRAALEQLRLSEEITANEPAPLFLPMWAYCYGRLGRDEDARRLFAEMERREASGTRFGAGGWAMAHLAVGDSSRAREWLETAADKAADHELDEGFFNLMALRTNITNDDVLRQRELAAVLDRIRGE
jgi:TolB-like protein/Flp pilus assembly protein TadD